MKKSLLLSVFTSVSVMLSASNNSDNQWFMAGGLCYRVISVEDATAGLGMPVDDHEAYVDYEAFLNGLAELSVPAVATDASTGTEYRVTTVFEEPLTNRPNIKKITLAEGITEINGINGCTALSELILPQSLQSINGIKTLPALVNLDLPAGLTAIGEESFIETGLKSLKIPAGIGIIPNLAIRNNANLEELDISNVTDFSEGAICNNPGIKRLVLPNTPFISGYHTFSLEGLEELWIGDRLTSNDANICSQAFSGLNSLKYIYCARIVPPTITELNPMYHPLCFDGISNWMNITLYVPTGYKDIYSSVYCWQDMDIVEYNFESSLAGAARAETIISTVPGGIRIEAEGSHPIAVYTPSGAKVSSLTASQGDHISLGCGLYIVTCDGYSMKVAVK